MVGDTPIEKENNEELARDRTHLAEDRTLLAVERTMASWMGASMGAIGVGLGFRAIFDKIQPDWLPRLIATFFMLLAVTLVIGAKRRAADAIHRMSSNWVEPPSTTGLRIAAYGIALGAGILTVAIWVFFD